MGSSRASFIGAAAAGALAAFAPCDALRAAIEKPSFTIGTAVDSPTQLPLYLAVARTFKEQGLDVKALGFRGDAEVAQALAGGSIDVCLASSTGLINLISAGQPAVGFYAGFNQADFAWVAQSSIKSWRDLKGKNIGVSTFGSLTDVITRYVLKKNGLTPEKDVQIIQAGGSPSAFSAMKSSKLQAAIMNAPFKWEALDLGFTLLGTQARDVSPGWPKHLYYAKKAFVDGYPETVTALLRAHVAAIRLARSDRALAVKTYVDRLKFDETYANRAYDEAMPGYDERGHLPEKSMATFWKLTIENGDVKEPWPDAKFLDARWVDSFNRWAPKA
ncbi:MAG TPA: ABC transporter substrate-binding protein [Candidatus Binatia bacterium]|nr:ABC transporter substrate-binding protein [Candidatus Binatia bacterium]